MTLGIGIPWQLNDYHPGAYDRVLDMLRPPAWYDWTTNRLGDAGYTPTVWQAKLGPWFSAQIERAQAGPRVLYLLGNEPERAEQSNTTPHEFAQAVRTWQALVGGRWAGPGILWGDGGRKWLAEYLRIGGPPPTVWTIHIYGSETARGWDDQYQDARRFLGTLGAERPIWVTETAARGGVATQAALLRNLAWRDDITAYWYSAYDPFGDNRASDLVNEDVTALTPLGREYANLHGAAGAGTEQTKRYMPFVAG